MQHVAVQQPCLLCLGVALCVRGAEAVVTLVWNEGMGEKGWYNVRGILGQMAPKHAKRLRRLEGIHMLMWDRKRTL